MTVTNQQGQVVHGPQINASGNVQVGQIGDSYQIAQAQINLSAELVDVLLGTLAQEKQVDYGQPELLRKTWEPETVLIPTGSFIMGSDPADGVPPYETPAFSMDLPAYRLGKYPVTNKQYAYFIKETEQTAPVALGWEKGNAPAKEQENLPVRGVSWYDALAYCLWLIKETGHPYTLPSEAQWEKGARGSEGLLFPWGNEWQTGLCNTDCEQTTAVVAYPDGASPYGCWDMVGNAPEWTTSLWGPKRRHNLDPLSQYPWTDGWQPNAGHDDLKKSRQYRRVVRGGAAFVPDMPLRAARRDSLFPYHIGLTHGRVGFRVAINWESET